MGNAARKARKAAGTKFVHPTKEPTPLPMRRGAPRRKVARHMETLLNEADGVLPDWARQPKAEYVTSPVKKNKLTKLPKVEAAEPHTAEEIEALNLDPKPWRVGRRRFATALEADEFVDEIDPGGFDDLAVMSPRSKYEQDLKKYQ